MTPSAEIKVLSSLATREAYLELVPQFERASGQKVVTTWAGTVDIIKRMSAGESYDLIIASNRTIDDLIQIGRVENGSRVDIARTGIGIAIRRGAQRPDIRSAEALKRALVAAKAVGYSTGPSGVYLAALFERMGIAAEMKAKSRTAWHDRRADRRQRRRRDWVPADQRAPARRRRRCRRPAAGRDTAHHRDLLRDTRRGKGRGRRPRAGPISGRAGRQRRYQAGGAAAGLKDDVALQNAAQVFTDECDSSQREPVSFVLAIYWLETATRLRK